MQFSYCVKEQKPCVRWIEKYFKDCLCNLRDDLSFGFGFISLVCWGVAEIPQIITNFQTKSGHGVSLAFLLTWVVGDVFNLVGCVLEPATLPTQYYTALLYTTSTVVLVLQSVYYEHIRRWFKCRQINVNQAAEEEEKPLRSKSDDPGRIQIPRSATPKGSTTPRRDQYHYYMSPRSLAGSGTPPFRSYLRAAKSGPSAMEALHNDSSSEDEAAPIPSNKSVSRPRPIPRSAAGYGTFLAASVNLPLQTKGLTEAYVGLTGRNLFHEQGGENVYGQWLGWLMAAIYMGGRLPQIWLNIKRGSVEGLNPLMFIFALVANATYVARSYYSMSITKTSGGQEVLLMEIIVETMWKLLPVLKLLFLKY
ncbi:probable vacuolar amino acid transporter YPQ3 isoform X3 [Juglans microcarpa x Juglans regia]|uniref:probable vacuolar amino acid transporter YPQ3 isoform X3 n=1 Tax=Juglans microcarpa x Juglans regia TaxID=2249226 RepID=UPI001B7F5493|nr:probable vacuolar amino acid transporter YPQ3 isoform X3 [Juglans microcarpa x Juglans regia]